MEATRQADKKSECGYWIRRILRQEGMGEMSDHIEYEEISADEVDRIVGELNRLMESTDSTNIRAMIADAANEILSLVYEEDELDSQAA